IRIRFCGSTVCVCGGELALSGAEPGAADTADAVHDRCDLRGHSMECPQKYPAAVVHDSLLCIYGRGRPVADVLWAIFLCPVSGREQYQPHVSAALPGSLSPF